MIFLNINPFIYRVTHDYKYIHELYIKRVKIAFHFSFFFLLCIHHSITLTIILLAEMLERVEVSLGHKPPKPFAFWLTHSVLQLQTIPSCIFYSCFLKVTHFQETAFFQHATCYHIIVHSLAYVTILVKYFVQNNPYFFLNKCYECVCIILSRHTNQKIPFSYYLIHCRL